MQIKTILLKEVNETSLSIAWLLLDEKLQCKDHNVTMSIAIATFYNQTYICVFTDIFILFVFIFLLFMFLRKK